METHKTSFFITLALFFLLPIFFVPGGALSLGVAKSALLIFAVILIVKEIIKARKKKM